MKTITSMLTALMLLLLMATPGFAGGGDTGDDTVTKTFELTLSGDIPEDQLFLGFVATREQVESGMEAGTDAGTVILFCGDVPDEIPDEIEQDPTIDFVVVSSEACEGGEGTEYAAEVELERGAEIAFVVFREDLETGEDFEIIASTELDEQGFPAEFETIDEDTTNSISCNFENGSCGTGQGANDQQMPGMMPDDMMDMMGGETPDMPSTGAGGMAGASGSLPMGNIAGGVSLLLLSCYGLLRRR